MLAAECGQAVSGGRCSSVGDGDRGRGGCHWSHVRVSAVSGCSLSAPATAPCLAAQTTDTERGQTVMFTSGRLRESSLRMDRADSQGDWIC